MSYCTLEDIKKLIQERFIIQLTDDESLGVVNTDRVDEAIRKAGSLIDGYCSKRYDTPFSTVPELIRTLSIDLAVYFIYARNSNETMPELRAVAYERAMEELQKIENGLFILDAESSSDSNTFRVITNKTLDDRAFTKDTLLNF